MFHVLFQGGEKADYIGAVRVFGIAGETGSQNVVAQWVPYFPWSPSSFGYADKILFEQLVKLDNKEMIM